MFCLNNYRHEGNIRIKKYRLPLWMLHIERSSRYIGGSRGVLSKSLAKRFFPIRLPWAYLCAHALHILISSWFLFLPISLSLSLLLSHFVLISLPLSPLSLYIIFLSIFFLFLSSLLYDFLNPLPPARFSL